MAPSPSHRQLALAEIELALIGTSHTQQLGASAFTTYDLYSRLRNAESLAEKLSQCLVRGAVHWWSSQRDLERTISDANHSIAARTRRHTHFERDRAVFSLNAKPAHGAKTKAT